MFSRRLGFVAHIASRTLEEAGSPDVAWHSNASGKRRNYSDEGYSRQRYETSLSPNPCVAKHLPQKRSDTPVVGTADAWGAKGCQWFGLPNTSVPQEPLLFHRTIKENIAYYHANIDDADIVKEAKAAHAHEFIDKLPAGYDTLVGEGGIKLSGGQKQRVAIARAILKKAPLLIFDEATSALDSESEQIIQRALPEIIGKQTAIVIAHRLSTVAGLDRIIVTHEGRVAESGTHDELVSKQGQYASLWHKQTTEFSTLPLSK